MYEYLDAQKKKIEDAQREEPGQSFEESLKNRVGAFGGGNMDWIYGNDIAGVWEAFVESEKASGA